MGKGAWSGRLPLGAHTLEAREEGYLDGRIEHHVEAGREVTVKVGLRINSAHPRWARAAESRLYAEAFAGFGLAKGLGSGAERSCDETANCEDALATGPTFGLRAGYEFPIHVALELAAGYLSLSKSFSRSMSTPATPPQESIRYQLSDSVRLDGPFVSLGLAYRKDWGSFGLDARAHLGVLLARTRDDVTGTASAGTASARASVENAGASTRSAALFVAPGIQLRKALGAWHIGAGFELPIFPLAGPDGAHGELVIDGTCNAAAPTPLDCAQNDARTVGERTHGRFFLLVPELSFGRAF